MGYSEGQIRIIRDALRAYRAYTPGWKTPSLTWSEVTAKVAEETGVDLGKDTLRQFTEGITSKPPIRYRAISDKVARGLADFLIHVGALYEEELQEIQPPGYQAPLRLMQYLQGAFTDGPAADPHKLQGVFRTITRKDDMMVEWTLSLEAPGEEGLVHVTEAYEVRSLREIKKGQSTQFWRYDKDEIKLHKDSSGWGIVTPEDNLFLFMKQRPYETNHYFLSLGTELDFWSDSSINRLPLYRHAYPIEGDTANALEPEIREKFSAGAAQRLIIFDRV